jgi:hypothetical protein
LRYNFEESRITDSNIPAGPAHPEEYICEIKLSSYSSTEPEQKRLADQPNVNSKINMNKI